ncbi:methanogenesis marker 2 protein [Methanobrevibacter sp. DSM 116169]|uniref:methanogenesis marker 2 protein n=1 Tax=Methanobrevibacter sp. DSM 116169 TaxID=3242727 RepID=UPI0038FCB260
MNLDNLVKSIKEFEGVTRKNSIETVTNILDEVYNISGNVIIENGDDASAIDIGNNQAILFAADGIWEKLIELNPYWAGYCSVLVNVNDIAAMGGKPLAMVNILSINNAEFYEDLLSGIKDGCIKFGIPMVGGHLHPDAEFTSLGVSIIGIAQKDKIITSNSANVGDKVIVAIDLDGAPHEQFALNWDTTYNKDSTLVQNQITAIQNLAEKDLFTAGKDISNPGILGTLEMLLESSKKGAIVDLEKIPKNSNIDWEQWLKSYPGSGFVFTSKEENCKEIIDYLKKFSIESNVVGTVTDDNKLYLTYEDEKLVVFNQDINPVFKSS